MTMQYYNSATDKRAPVKLKIYILAGILVLSSFLLFAANTPDSKADYSDIGRLTMEQFAAGKYDELSNNFISPAKTQVSAGTLKQIWDGIIKQYGKFKSVSEKTNQQFIKGVVVVYVTCEFENAKIVFKVVINNEKKVVGFFINPSKSVPASISDNYVEKEICIVNGEWKLPGALLLPKTKPPFPVVVLVHGSGPNDRNETIGPNMPFMDIAIGLASRGIATLRYDKRTFVYGDKMSKSENITVNDETIDDAITATEMLKNNPDIISDKIYVLGHSLGGTLIPRIALKTRNVIAGYIILAGAARPMEDLIMEQSEYLLKQNKTLTMKDKQAQQDIVKGIVNSIKNVKPEDLKSTTKIFHAPASYWLDLQGYRPAETAKKITKPILILQGGRDYQVTQKDFAIWKKELSGNTNVEFKLSPDLNHLFMQGKGECTPEEYFIKKQVFIEVIDDIANFIKENQ